MNRVVVTGNIAGGKSTLSRSLQARLGLPCHPLDQLQWRPGWQPVPREEFSVIHANLVSKPRWILEGWSDFETLAERLACCDTIILVDYPIWHHYWWFTKRQFRCLFRPGFDGPDCPLGCPMIPQTWKLMKTIWIFHKHALPCVRDLVQEHGQGKRVFHIRTPDDLSQFHCEAERYAHLA